MGSYSRLTAASRREALEVAESYLTSRIPLEKVGSGDHEITISAHRHGPETQVDVATDQLRTSRIDTEVQHYLEQLPYQPGDRATRGTTGA
jgi:hypothetical protein